MSSYNLKSLLATNLKIRFKLVCAAVLNYRPYFFRLLLFLAQNRFKGYDLKYVQRHAILVYSQE